MASDYTKGMLFGGGCMILGFALSNFVISPTINAPKNTNPEYVNPKSIEFKLEDKDHNKMKETYIKVNDKEYLFKIVDGTPKCVPYTLESKVEYKIKESTGAVK